MTIRKSSSRASKKPPILNTPSIKPVYEWVVTEVDKWNDVNSVFENVLKIAGFIEGINSNPIAFACTPTDIIDKADIIIHLMSVPDEPIVLRADTFIIDWDFSELNGIDLQGDVGIKQGIIDAFKKDYIDTLSRDSKLRVLAVELTGAFNR